MLKYSISQLLSLNNSSTPSSISVIRHLGLPSTRYIHRSTRRRVSVKTWNIYPIDDGLEENHETFTVTLKNAKNAVLGQRMSASVEIIDPRGDVCGSLEKVWPVKDKEYLSAMYQEGVILMT
ncbi:hypothetical protein F7725_028350 [Dissostichus mawsoni]|uniref:Uncharacterized protein n=1 Tax=Dissostichus mawsoni TaxID=36200 RepID=A0A7J5XFG9_DISMA|nr:hypothetical protein F7725_028350 [Dissostichus mawsoni]